MSLDFTRVLRFVSVAENLSFTKSAALLEVDQSWLSRQIMQLEDQIGFTLFDRSRTGIMLTPEGREFYEASRAIAEAAGNLCKRAEEIAQRRRHEVRVGVSYSSFSVPSRRKLLSRFSELRPNTDLQCEACQFTPEVIEKVMDGSFDFGICYGPVEVTDVDVCVLENIEMTIAVPKEWPIARQEAIALADLAGQTVALGLKNIKAEAHQRAWSWVEEVGAAFRFVPEGRRYVFDVAERERAAMVCFTEADRIPDTFVKLPIVGPRPHLNLSLIRYRRVLSSSAERLWRLAQEMVADEAAPLIDGDAVNC